MKTFDIQITLSRTIREDSEDSARTFIKSWLRQAGVLSEVDSIDVEEYIDEEVRLQQQEDDERASGVE